MRWFSVFEGIGHLDFFSLLFRLLEVKKIYKYNFLALEVNPFLFLFVWLYWSDFTPSFILFQFSIVMRFSRSRCSSTQNSNSFVWKPKNKVELKNVVVPFWNENKNYFIEAKCLKMANDDQRSTHDRRFWLENNLPIWLGECAREAVHRNDY